MTPVVKQKGKDQGGAAALVVRSNFAAEWKQSNTPWQVFQREVWEVATKVTRENPIIIDDEQPDPPAPHRPSGPKHQTASRSSRTYITLLRTIRPSKLRVVQDFRPPATPATLVPPIPPRLPSPPSERAGHSSRTYRTLLRTTRPSKLRMVRDSRPPATPTTLVPPIPPRSPSPPPERTEDPHVPLHLGPCPYPPPYLLQVSNFAPPRSGILSPRLSPLPYSRAVLSTPRRLTPPAGYSGYSSAPNCHKY
ncbi:hypothetical protein RSOL_388240, partial [Rhizoctonia solani AG-3 Rhs1AP]